jgi:hypothetical protein
LGATEAGAEVGRAKRDDGCCWFTEGGATGTEAGVLCEDGTGVLVVLVLVVDGAGGLNCVLVNRLLAGRTGSSSSSDEHKSMTVGMAALGRPLAGLFVP